MDDHHLMEKALQEAKRALAAGEFPVGCVMAHNGKIMATGSRTSSSLSQRNELDHAEMIALRRLLEKHPDLPREDIVVFSTLEPCLMCYSTLIVNGIRQFVFSYEDVFGGGTDLALSSLKPLYRDLRPSIVSGILRKESLALFKTYFSNPENDYLKGTPLAEHALGA